jgi:hypothetical protein
VLDLKADRGSRYAAAGSGNFGSDSLLAALPGDLVIARGLAPSLQVDFIDLGGFRRERVIAVKLPATSWSTKKYLNIELLKNQQMRGAIIV